MRASSRGPERSPAALPPQAGAPGALASRMSLNLADTEVIKLSQKVQSPAEALARSASKKAAANSLAVVGKLPSMKRGSLSKSSSKIVFPGVLEPPLLPGSGTTPPRTPNRATSLSQQQVGASGRPEGKLGAAGKPDSGQTATKHVLAGDPPGGSGASHQTMKLKAPSSNFKASDQAKQASRRSMRALKHLVCSPFLVLVHWILQPDGMYC